MTSKSLTATRVVGELKKCGITHLVWLPDSVCEFMYDSIMSQSEITLVPVCREGEAIPIAAGLTLGGKKPAILHQNTGFLESGDSIRSFLDFQIPLFLLIGYRGWWRNKPITDHAAIYTPPVLDAFGIKHYLVETDEDVERISIGYKEAHETRKPMAILIGREYQ